MGSDWLLWVALIVANISAYLGLGILFYGGWENYKELLWHLWHSGWGEWRLPWERWERDWELWTEHPWEMLRLLLYILCCAALVIGEYWLIRSLWPRPHPFMPPSFH